MKPIPIEVGNARRWADCLVSRSLFVFLIGPAVQLVAWAALWLMVPHLDGLASLSLVYGLCVANALVFGLLCWGESPARLRRRTMRWILSD